MTVQVLPPMLRRRTGVTGLFGLLNLVSWNLYIFIFVRNDDLLFVENTWKCMHL